MSLIGNYSGVGADWLGTAQIRLVEGTTAVVCRGGQWPSMAAYNLATGTMIWSRDGAEGSDLILQYDPRLIFEGKLLCRVETRTSVAYTYQTLGVTAGFANNGLGGIGLEIYEWTGVPCTNQIYPKAGSYYEVLDLATGDSLAKRSLDLGVISHEIPVPSGALDFSTSGPFPLECDEEYNSFASPPREMWWLVDTPAQPLVAYQPIAYDGYWWHYIGNGGNPDLGVPPVGDAYWIKRALILEPAETPIPPPHDTLKICALPDGSGLFFAPLDTPSVHRSYDVLIAGVPTTAAWGDPHTDGHNQSGYAYDWDLNDLWSVDLGQVAVVGQPVAIGPDVHLSWYDLAAEVMRFRRFSPTDGSTVAEATSDNAALISTSPIITSATRLVRVDYDGAVVLNLPDLDP